MAVLATTDRLDHPGVIAEPGVPAAETSYYHLLPLLANAYALEEGNDGPGTLTTMVRVRNPGHESVHATLTYLGTDAPRNAAACRAGATIVHGETEVEIAPGAEVAFHQGGASQPPERTSGLPSGCLVSGVLRFRNDEVAATLATVDIYDGSDSSWASYAPAGQGGRRFFLPLLRREHTNSRLTTPMQIMNVGDVPATISLQLKLSDGSNPCVGGCNFTVAPRSGYLWLPADVGGFGANRYGWAGLESDQPVVVAVADVALAGGLDMTAYLGLAEGATESRLPLLLRSYRLADVPQLPSEGPTSRAFLPWANTSRR